MDLEYIYQQLKDKYDLELTGGLALDAGFDWDVKVLTGESRLGRFYLYFNGINAVLDYDIDNEMSGMHWHPGDTEEALRYVVEFMEGTII